jgi:hypothetical protein
MIDSAARSCGAVSTSSQVSSQKRPTSKSCDGRSDAPQRAGLAVRIVRRPHLGAGQEGVQQVVERLLVAVAVEFGVARVLVVHGERQQRDVLRCCLLDTVAHGGLRA